MDPHHIEGRHGDGLILFVWLHRQCHNWLHLNVARARALGLIVYSYEIEKNKHYEFRELENNQGVLVDSRIMQADEHPAGSEEKQGPLSDSSGEDPVV